MRARWSCRPGPSDLGTQEVGLVVRRDSAADGRGRSDRRRSLSRLATLVAGTPCGREWR
ncbi:hypothetical protein ACFPM0_33335 [Pseudonocardia sulfidoxydans]|uniref:hypothetical protein n=1 Tax=Pseudonocardia sulfidoxydans TaxID=54011 RepID=UPI00361D353C